MKKVMLFASAALAFIALNIGPTVAVAQTPAAQPTTTSNVEHWTTKEWNHAKRTWQKDTAKWADCEQQSMEQRLSGRKSWSFLYHCMT
jgi:hypothetical protein